MIPATLASPARRPLRSKLTPRAGARRADTGLRTTAPTSARRALTQIFSLEHAASARVPALRAIPLMCALSASAASSSTTAAYVLALQALSKMPQART